MRIAQLTQDWFLNGGVATYVRDLADALAGSGHEVLVVHAGDGDERLPGVTVQGVPGFSQDRRDGKALERADGVLTRLSAFGPDVVHIHCNDNFVLERALRGRYPAVKTLHVHDFCPTGNKFHYAFNRPCEHRTGWLCVPRMVYKRCTRDKRPHVWWRFYRRAVAANECNSAHAAIVVASEYVRKQAIASGYRPDRVRTLPYFTTPPPVVPPPPVQPDTILFCGRLAPEKGVDLLLQAVARVNRPWRLIVAGDGMEREPTERLARRLGVSARVEFCGWTDRGKLRDLYDGASVVAVPSRWPEPFGIVGIEAMAHARPVVAFAVGGIPEWLEDGVTGFLVRPYDLDALADRLRACLESPELARALGERGRARVEAAFSVGRHLDGLMAVYADARCAPSPGAGGRS